jgi:hypothetical protein
MVSEMLSPILGPLGGAALCYGIYHLARFIYHELTYPLRNVRGPRNASLFFGNLRQLKVDSELQNGSRLLIMLHICPERRPSNQKVA